MPSEPAKARLRLVADNAPRAPETGPRPVLDDSELLAALRKADPAASTAVYHRARPIVERTVSRLLGQGDREYEDVIQLSFVEFIDTIDRFRGDCPLDAWISVIAARAVYRHIRRRRLERKLFAAVPPDELGERSARALAPSVVLRNALTRVQHHLKDMDDARAWAFLLHDVVGYDLKEISQILGVSLSAAQSRLVRGRRELHERLQGDPGLARFLDDYARGGDET